MRGFGGAGTDSCPSATGSVQLVQQASVSSTNPLAFAEPVAACDLVVTVDATAPSFYISAGGETAVDGLVAWEFSGFAGDPAIDESSTGLNAMNQFVTSFDTGVATTTIDDELAISVATTEAGGKIGAVAAPFVGLPTFDNAGPAAA